MHDKERRIREQRQIEATKNGFTGLGGKFGTIVKYLGQPILMETSLQTFYPNPLEIDETNEIATLSEDFNYIIMGFAFDGLTRGMHLEIKYIDETKDLRVQYKGCTVYQEINSELCCYTPHPEWEAKIESLYKIAKIKEDEARQIENAEAKEERKNDFIEFLKNLKTRWGFGG